MNDEFDDAELVDAAIRARLFDVLTTLPGQVQSYDRATQTVDVQPLPASYQDGEPVAWPILRAVPVAFPRAGGAAITWPIVSGDHVLLHFASRALDRWLATGDAGDPQSPRAQHLSDAVAVPGVWPGTSRLAGLPSSPQLELRAPTGGKISLGKDAVEAAVLGDTLRAQLATVLGLIAAHGHVAAGAPTGPAVVLPALTPLAADPGYAVTPAVLAADVLVK